MLCRSGGVLCGTTWFDACFRQVAPAIEIEWWAHDGDLCNADQHIGRVHGAARAILTAERTALNFLQTLSATATATRQYVDAVRGTHAVIMDTRKTLPGLRLAQKYAVKVGGGRNQRVGLHDGILIKENHIAAAGGIAAVLRRAHAAAGGKAVQIEVETLAQFEEALSHGAKLILLDNFDTEKLRKAVSANRGRALLEASGGITLENVREVAETGVDRISIGSLTKHVQAIDLSLRIAFD